MGDYFEINITLNGKHFFATADRSITNKSKLNEVYNVLKEKFPESEGYGISVTEWKQRGTPINMNV